VCPGQKQSPHLKTKPGKKHISILTASNKYLTLKIAHILPIGLILNQYLYFAKEIKYEILYADSTDPSWYRTRFLFCKTKQFS
jgi:hypothetical protein